MNALEKQTYADGFAILLLGCQLDRRTWWVAVSARLFDGGRCVRSVDREAPLTEPDDTSLDAVRELLVAVRDPPAIAAVHGNGWRETLELCFSDAAPELRVLDLHRAACCLAGVPNRAPLAQLAGRFGMQTVLEEDPPLTRAYEELLWAVAAEANEQEMDWGGLLRAAEGSGRTGDGLGRAAACRGGLAGLSVLRWVRVRQRDA